MRSLTWKTAVAIASVAVVGLSGISSASASSVPAPLASAGEIADYEADFSAAAANDSEVTNDLDKYLALSDADQARFVAIMTSEDPLSAPEVMTIETEDTTKTVANAVEGSAVSRAATVYDVTSSWSSSNSLFGVKIGQFDQTFKYQTGSNKVLSSQYCKGSFTGFSGPFSLSTSDSHFVTSGRGTCITDFRLSFVYEGSGWTANKRMTLVVNGPGIVSKTLVNI